MKMIKKKIVIDFKRVNTRKLSSFSSSYVANNPCAAVFFILFSPFDAAIANANEEK